MTGGDIKKFLDLKGLRITGVVVVDEIELKIRAEVNKHGEDRGGFVYRIEDYITKVKLTRGQKKQLRKKAFELFKKEYRTEIDRIKKSYRIQVKNARKLKSQEDKKISIAKQRHKEEQRAKREYREKHGKSAKEWSRILKDSSEQAKAVNKIFLNMKITKDEYLSYSYQNNRKIFYCPAFASEGL
jgi:hypothetical protein